MPTVRTATDLGLGQQSYQGAGTTPAQQFRTDADMFGAVQGRNASEAGSKLTDYANRLIKAEDERASMEVENAIRDWSHETLQGQNGIYNKKGGNAIGATKGVVDGYKKFSADLLKGKIVSSATRQRIEQYIGERGDSMRREVSRYEVQQKRAYDAGLRKARIEGAMEDAALYYNDPKRLAEAKQKILSTHGANASANGWSNEQKNEQIENDISKMHIQVMDRMLATNQGGAAQAYFEANKGEIDGGDIIAVEKAVTQGALANTAQEATDAIMSAGMSQEDALKEARKNFKGKQRDEVVRRVKVRYAEKSSMDAAANKQLQQSGWEKIAQGGTPDDLTAAELAAAGRQVESMWNMAANSRSRGKGFALSSETGVVQEYAAMTDSEIAEQDLTPLMPKLTENDWNKVNKRKQDAERNIKELLENPGQGATVERLLKEFAPKNWKVGLRDASTERRAQAQRARDNMNEFVRNTIEKTGKVPSEEEMRRESARIMMQVNTDGIAWFSDESVVSEQGDTPITGLHLDGDDLVTATGVPKQYIKEVEDFIKSQGQPVTINNMIKVWESREAR